MEGVTCNVDYEGSAGGMEKLSAVNILKRSVEKSCAIQFIYWGW